MSTATDNLVRTPEGMIVAFFAWKTSPRARSVSRGLNFCFDLESGLANTEKGIREGMPRACIVEYRAATAEEWDRAQLGWNP